jgi:hypothetical protein
MMPAEFRWLEGPIVVKPATYRQQLIESMARSLQEAGTAGDERDAIRSLFGNGYAMADIIMLLDDARALAFQEIVAKEMSRS